MTEREIINIIIEEFVDDEFVEDGEILWDKMSKDAAEKYLSWMQDASMDIDLCTDSDDEEEENRYWEVYVYAKNKLGYE